jgi:hypothetical protein
MKGVKTLEQRKAFEEIEAEEIGIIINIYRAGGRVQMVAGDKIPQSVFKPDEKPLLEIANSWYFKVDHSEVLTVLQGFLNDIQTGRRL